MKDEQKEALAKAIDNGMKQKGELTLIVNEYTEKKAEKQARTSSIDNMTQENNKLIKEAETKRQTIAS